MSNAYSRVPLIELTNEELEEILITADGRGREVKKEALRILIWRILEKVRVESMEYLRANIVL